MELRRRFRYITVAILLIPLFAILVTVFAMVVTWSLGRDETDDLSAPRYMKPILREILTEGESSVKGFTGILIVFDDHGNLVYADSKVREILDETQWGVEEAYSEMMARMPDHPFNVSVYRYKGKAGIVIFLEDFFTRVKIFRAIGLILFFLYLILIVVPVLMINRFMRPLGMSLINLENAAGEIGRGNLDVDIMEGQKRIRRPRRHPTHPTPLKNLIEAFEKMRLELKDNHERQSRVMMSISHDLKTPLTLIKGYVEALKDGMAETPEDVVEYAQVIHDRTILLEERISDLIHFSRLQTTDWQARFASIPFHEFMDETAGIFKNDTFIRKRQFDFQLNIPSHTRVKGDRRMLFQVFENLFDNSCRYTEEGDKILLTVEIRDEEVLIKIDDSGPGISEEHLPYIFDNFYRADPGRNTRGMGIGLNSAKTIVRNHGGDIVYERSPLGGAGFLVMLPLDPDSASE